MTNPNKSTMRKTLLENGIRPRGMTDMQILAAYLEITNEQPEPKPETRPLRRAPGKKSKPTPKPKAKKAQPTPKPEPKQPHVDADKLSQLGEMIASLVDAPKVEIDESKVIDLIKQHSNAPQRIEYEIKVTRPEGETKAIKGAHAALADVLDIAAIGENIFLAGPAAAGKTTLAKQLADALGYDFQFTGAVTDQFELSGYIDANGTFHERSFYKACTYAERGFDGCVFLFDEADASLPSALLWANAGLENGYVEFPTGRVEFDPEKVIFLCAANTKGKGANREYTGRYPLDDAFLNRFELLDMDYDLAVELTMAENAWLKAGGDSDQISIAQDYAHEVIALRRQLAEKQIKVVISPRNTRRGAGLLARGWPIEKVRKGLHSQLNDDQKRTLGL